MNYRIIARVLGLVLLAIAVLMLLPLIAGLCYGESVLHFIITIAIAALLGFVLTRFKPRSREMYAREGFVTVGLAWIIISLVGALPFVLNGDIPNYIDAVFETVSGFTTTGASILHNVEEMSRGNLFWRMFTHWIGGMGVLVFIMAVMPMSGEHSMHIMRAEVPGPTVGKLVPRARKTASLLYLIYMVMTLVETVLLLLGGMNFYDALLHSFATAGTGGFSTRASSIGAFDSAYIDVVIGVFMLLFSINFNLYFLILIGRVKEALKSEELHWFLIIVALAVVGIALGINSAYNNFLTSLRHAFFNVASIVSTTGFGTVDFVKWPQYCQWIIVLLMFMGACAGSTGGGMKVSRVATLMKSARAELRMMVRPRSVETTRLEGKIINASAIKAVFIFFFLYLMILLSTTFIISFDGNDFTTNFTASLSCISNIGPGLSLVGPTGNFDIFSYPSKIMLSFTMLLGRLEIFPILVLFSRRTWKK